MGEVNGSYVTTVDGVDFYTDEFKHSTADSTCQRNV